ncbi:MAG TPA: glycosyltransferase family 39 protein, partial [Chloroflexota bacterium]|nr:glycosyltransferase family 39 protein [Chloroflexota bacterium]
MGNECKPYSSLITHHSSLVLALLTAGGLALRLVDLGRESFWLDEAGRAAIAAQPLGAIPSAVGVIELSPPLYHLLLHGWLRVVGDGDVAARLLSALLGAAAIPATYLLASALLDRRTALVAALLAAVAPL